MNTNNYPDKATAEGLLAWAAGQNPGPWVRHSETAARAAKTIAGACGLDGDKAYALGLLHDIGRYEGVNGLHHTIAGHGLLLQKGYPLAARICLTHSFPIKNIQAYIGQTSDCTAEELALLEATLAGVQYDAYDNLIQLCDALCLPEGVCLLQVRLMDVARRHGFNVFTLSKWEAYFALKAHFDRLYGGNIYDLFYNEIHNVSFQ